MHHPSVWLSFWLRSNFVLANAPQSFSPKCSCDYTHSQRQVGLQLISGKLYSALPYISSGHVGTAMLLNCECEYNDLQSLRENLKD